MLCVLPATTPEGLIMGFVFENLFDVVEHFQISQTFLLHAHWLAHTAPLRLEPAVITTTRGVTRAPETTRLGLCIVQRCSV